VRATGISIILPTQKKTAHLLEPLNKIRALDKDRAPPPGNVEAGIRYGELATWLHARGYALHNMASCPYLLSAAGLRPHMARA